MSPAFRSLYSDSHKLIHNSNVADTFTMLTVLPQLIPVGQQSGWLLVAIIIITEQGDLRLAPTSPVQTEIQLK